jgi:hypothetical protein
MFNTRYRSFSKRELIKCNMGGRRSNPQITGIDNQINFYKALEKKEQTTLLRKADVHFGRKKLSNFNNK